LGEHAQQGDDAGHAATRHLDDLVLLVRALRLEASALTMLADPAAALPRLTEVLDLAHDPAASRRLDHPAPAEAIARAHWNWVRSAQRLTAIRCGTCSPCWTRPTGGWPRPGAGTGAPLSSASASVRQRLGELDAAARCAQEALDVAMQHPDAPG
jgi:hypothetical protein